jgi:hypothetical protein
MQWILSRSGYFVANGLARTVKIDLWGRPPASLHYPASFHSSKRTTIRLFYIAHHGQSEEDSGRIVRLHGNKRCSLRDWRWRTRDW